MDWKSGSVCNEVAIVRIRKILLISALFVGIGVWSGCANRSAYNPYPQPYPQQYPQQYQAYPYTGQPGQQIQASPIVGSPPLGAPQYGAPPMGVGQGQQPTYMQPLQPYQQPVQQYQQTGQPFFGR